MSTEDFCVPGTMLGIGEMMKTRQMSGSTSGERGQARKLPVTVQGGESYDGQGQG